MLLTDHLFMEGSMALPGSARDWLTCVGFALLVSTVSFGGICGLLHYWFYVRRRDDAARWKLQAGRWLTRAQIRDCIVLGGANLAYGTVIGGTLAWYTRRGGWSRLYFEPSARGWVYTVASTLAAFVLIDAALYYSHRLLHHRLLFRHVHRWHHRFVAPVVFTTLAMHPAEFVLYMSLTLAPIFILPLWAPAFVGLVVYTYLIGIVDHTGVRLPWRLPVHGDGEFHNQHHIYFHCNFGHHTALFDRLHGTVRRGDRHYDEHTFGGRGTARRKQDDDHAAA
jgi:lathosterol oxidase